ncbi:hypothetical protein SAMN05421755_11514 [Nitrosomonas sp. Nm33]|nr:hypothetical protein SAMN05421755_11514 [Nitrosomonas sp. Nm33]
MLQVIRQQSQHHDFCRIVGDIDRLSQRLHHSVGLQGDIAVDYQVWFTLSLLEHLHTILQR